MYRILTFVLTLIPLLAAPAVAQEDNRILLRWYGHSFFQLESPQGVRVAFDPHAIEEYGLPAVSAEFALISHPHEDHNQSAALANRQQVKELQAVKGELRRALWVNIDETSKDVRMHTLPAAVGTYHDRTNGRDRGKNGVFIVDVAGVRFVHLGDLGHTLSDQQAKALGDVDVLMIPVGGIYTINGSDAKKIVEQIKPKRYVIPMHFGTEVYDYLLSPEEFLDGQEKIKDLSKTNVLVIDPEAKVEGSPEIVRLGWKK